jgi:hypothetical protein
MKPQTRLLHILIGLILTVAGSATVSAQAGGGGGGGGRGGGGGTPGLGRPMPAGGMVSEALVPNQLNDVEMTELTRAEMQGPLGAAKRSITQARAALNAAVLKVPSAPAEIAASVQALADAELAAALSRADLLAQFQRNMKNVTAERRNALVNALSN